MVVLFPFGMPLAGFVKLYQLRGRINRRDEQGRTRESQYYGSSSTLGQTNSGNSLAAAAAAAATAAPPASPKPKLRSMDTPHNLVRGGRAAPDRAAQHKIFITAITLLPTLITILILALALTLTMTRLTPPQTRQHQIAQRWVDDPALAHSCVRPLFKNIRPRFWCVSRIWVGLSVHVRLTLPPSRPCSIP